MSFFTTSVCRALQSLTLSSTVDTDIESCLSVSINDSILNIPLGSSPAAEWFINSHHIGKVHEPGLVMILALLASTIRQPVTFFDIGSLYGYHSAIACHLFGNRSLFYAVEANPNSCQHITRMAKSLPNLHVLNSFISNESSLEEYLIDGYVIRPYSIRKHFFSLAKSFIRLSVKGELRLVEKRLISSLTLSDLLSRRIPNSVPIFKMDTEGYQAIFLPPYVKMLCDAEAFILLELDDPDVMRSYGSSNANLIEPFISHGYNAAWIDHRNPSDCIPITYLPAECDRNSLVVLYPPCLDSLFN